MASEPTLYERGKPQFEEPVHWDWLDELVRAGVLVERKRCVHGNIDRHEVNHHGMIEKTEWCPGAGIGGDDESR